ncbi:MAG: molecular chaperone HtpG [Anaerolineae bacterium]|nr:molecular chaperone HtpG [Anaerolineae bacterium]
MTEQHAFRAEIQQLLDILIHSLYTNRDIFLRELVSNASDALNRLQFEQLTTHEIADPSADLYIEIVPDEAAGTLTIRDTGIGMTRDELIENLGVIAHSGAKAFIQAMRESKDVNAADVIGQFGVGFYSAFMVAERIRVVSKSYRPDEPAFAWESTGGDTYTLEEAEHETRGTNVILYLRDDAKDYLQPWKIKEIIRHHSNYIAFPIHVGDDEEPTNKQVAIWRQDSKEITDEQYDDFYKMLTLDFEAPSHRIHMRVDSPMQFYALLYIPSSVEQSILNLRREPGLKLYAHKVLIEEYNKELLPEYLQFVQGVVDSEDLPLAVSRESIQANRVMANLKKTLTSKVLSELKRLMKSKPEVYRQIFDNFGRFIKQGLVASPGDANDIMPLLLFKSTATNGDDMTTLGEYATRMVRGQSEIYYVIADDDVGAARSPHLDPFRRRGVEVLYFSDPVDPFMLMGLSEYEGYKLRNVDEADIDLSSVGELKEDESEAQEALPEDSFTAVRQRFVDLLGERVLDVRSSQNLVESPARLISTDSGVQRQMYRINRMLDREFELPVKILELNPRHPLVHNLSQMIASQPDNPLIDMVVTQVFETALLQDGIHPDPASMAERLTQIMQAATTRD